MNTQFLQRWNAADIANWATEASAADDDPATRLVHYSPLFTPAAPIREVIPSWAATTPPGSWIEIQLRAQIAGNWTKFFRVASWDAAEAGSRRRSFPPQADAQGELATDTLRFQVPAGVLQVRILLCAPPASALPRLRSFVLCGSSADEDYVASRSLPLIEPIMTPLYSQYGFADGAGWCSPVALAMLLGYWHDQINVQRLAPFAEPTGALPLVALVHDPAWQGTGNWSFNTAVAAMFGLDAFVTRLQNLEQATRWLAAGVPLICSLAWQPDELDGAPLPQSNGHLLLLTGCGAGRVHVADPAGQPGSVARSYWAAQFESCWQRASRGTVYLVYPHGWPTPVAGPRDAW